MLTKGNDMSHPPMRASWKATENPPSWRSITTMDHRKTTEAELPPTQRNLIRIATRMSC